MTYLYHVMTGEGEACASQVRVNVPPTLAAEPTNRRPNEGEARDALHALNPFALEPL